MKTPKPKTVKESSALQSAQIETDGLISVVASVLPPASQQTFISNGKSAKVVFEIIAARHIVIESAYFTGAYPLIQYITANDIGVAVNQPSGQMALIGVGDVDSNGIKLRLDVFFDTVDINTSGSIAILKLAALQYKTDDNIYHSYSSDNGIAAGKLCIINNIAGVLLQAPDDQTLDNGYKQIAKIKLTGDIPWVLNSLPLSLSSPFLREIPKSKLIIMQGEEQVAVSDEIELSINSRTETVIKFKGGLQLTGSQRKILTVYANTPHIGNAGNPIITYINPLSSLIWTDGSGAKISGAKNNLYFKQDAGRSVYDES